MKKPSIALFLTLGLLYGCGSDNILTKKEMAIQSKADAYVSGVLFENDMTETASYNVRKDGSVAIKFIESVSEKNTLKLSTYFVQIKQSMVSTQSKVVLRFVEFVNLI